ncbi:MAG: transglycosylase SLT domain-containing protein [Anaerolineae bacterium]
MAARTRQLAKQSSKQESRRILLRYFPVWLILSVVLTMTLPNIMVATLNTTVRVVRSLPQWVGELFASQHSVVIAPLFTAEVVYWSDDIARWADEYGLDPNLLATVMQIESCGHPTVSSYAGAQGLFQVMPFHFDVSEDQLDPDTNAMRGANFLNECLGYANGDTGLAMACYNGGPSVTTRAFNTWTDQTQRYYMWGTGIYADAEQNLPYSETLTRWLDAGGSRLCQQAASTLGIR